MLRAAPLAGQRLSRNVVSALPQTNSAFASCFAESTSVRYQSTAAPEPSHEEDSSRNVRTTLQREGKSELKSSRFPIRGPQGDNRRGTFGERWSQESGGGLVKNLSNNNNNNNNSSHQLGNNNPPNKTMAPFKDKMKSFFENRPKEATMRKPKPSLRSQAPSILQPQGRSRPWDLTPRTNETDSPPVPEPPVQSDASNIRVYSRQNQPPPLLDQLRQSQERYRRHRDYQKKLELSPPPPPQKLPNSGMGLTTPGTSTMTDGSAPLSELIRTLQKKHSQENAMRNRLDRTNNTGNKIGADNTPIPVWRLQPGQNRNSLREMRREHYQKQHGVPAAQSDFLKKGQQPKQAAVPKVDPKEQMVTIPSYDLSLAEVSSLFREKTTVLRNILIRLGEFPQVPDDQSPPPDESIYINPEMMELLALELEKPFEKSERESINRDEEILIQRRAASEAAVDESQGAAVVPYDSLPPRPPVVTVMGHVDHGKTTLMDALRRRAREAAGGGPSKKKKSKKDKKKAKTANRSGDIAGTEAGGITQVISAFQVPLQGYDQVGGGTVTFLDTPGHAAFRAMRESGSDAADIIVLVVAADDGVSKQTIEILEFYKSIVRESGSSGISLVVAMNKIDKPGINVAEARMRIESQLLEHGILVEGMPSQTKGEYGPPVQLFPISALKGEGIDDLIEGLALQSEVMDLRADDNTGAEGIVLDARVDKGLGVVADCIIRWGSLEKGDIVVSGTKRGKVRLLKDVSEKQLKKATPSQPVRIIGFDSVPKAGDPMIVVKSEEEADELVERRKALDKEEGGREMMGSEAELQSAGKHMMHHEWRTALETKYSIEGEDENAPIRIPVIVKADADGTLAALRESLLQIGKESRHNIVIDPILAGVGPALATDIQLAKESGASIICFNLKNEQTILSLAENEKVPMLNSKVIYTLLDESKKEFAKFLPKLPVEVVHGRAKVKAVFKIGGIDDKVAGLQVIDGNLYKEKTKGENGMVTCQFRVLRKGEPISTAPLKASSLKHFKDDVEEVSRGSECGLALMGHQDYEEADVIECYSVEMKEEFI